MRVEFEFCGISSPLSSFPIAADHRKGIFQCTGPCWHSIKSHDNYQVRSYFLPLNVDSGIHAFILLQRNLNLSWTLDKVKAQDQLSGSSGRCCWDCTSSPTWKFYASTPSLLVHLFRLEFLGKQRLLHTHPFLPRQNAKKRWKWGSVVAKTWADLRVYSPMKAEEALFIK